jgi:peptidase M28-like protein
MASVPPRTERRRARPGSLQRPVNGRLYRGTWLLVGLPLLVAAFSVARPTPLPRAFLPAFDGEAAKTLATDLADLPYRQPGSSQAIAAADFVRAQLEPYGLPVRTERFSARIPGQGKVELQNLVAEASGRSPRTIVVMAHRDNDGRGPGANDNASGTAMLIQLARAYGVPPGLPSGQLRPNHTILFLSTDSAGLARRGLQLTTRFVMTSPASSTSTRSEAAGASGWSSTATLRASHQESSCRRSLRVSQHKQAGRRHGRGQCAS